MRTFVQNHVMQLLILCTVGVVDKRKQTATARSIFPNCNCVTDNLQTAPHEIPSTDPIFSENREGTQDPYRLNSKDG